MPKTLWPSKYAGKHTVSERCTFMCGYSVSMSNTTPKWTSGRHIKENNDRTRQAHHTPFLPVLPIEMFVFSITAQFYLSKSTYNSRLDLHIHHHRFTGCGWWCRKAVFPSLHSNLDTSGEKKNYFLAVCNSKLRLCLATRDNLSDKTQKKTYLLILRQMPSCKETHILNNPRGSENLRACAIWKGYMRQSLNYPRQMTTFHRQYKDLPAE